MTRLSRAASNKLSTAHTNAVAPITSDRSVSLIVVPCPTCGKPEGERCVSANGKPAAHPTRRRMALRRLRLIEGTYDAEDLRFAQRMIPSARRAVRMKMRLTLSEVAVLIGSHLSTVRQWEAMAIQPTGPTGAAYGAWLRANLDAQPPTFLNGELPPVNLPAERSPSLQLPPQKPQPEGRLDYGSHCEDCDRWLPGERRLCGRCFNHRDTG